jgi:hypothetical protein
MASLFGAALVMAGVAMAQTIDSGKCDQGEITGTVTVSCEREKSEKKKPATKKKKKKKKIMFFLTSSFFFFFFFVRFLECRAQWVRHA